MGNVRNIYFCYKEVEKAPNRTTLKYSVMVNVPNKNAKMIREKRQQDYEVVRVK